MTHSAGGGGGGAEHHGWGWRSCASAIRRLQVSSSLVTVWLARHAQLASTLMSAHRLLPEEFPSLISRMRWPKVPLGTLGMLTVEGKGQVIRSQRSDFNWGVNKMVMCEQKLIWHLQEFCDLITENTWPWAFHHVASPYLLCVCTVKYLHESAASNTLLSFLMHFSCSISQHWYRSYWLVIMVVVFVNPPKEMFVSPQSPVLCLSVKNCAFWCDHFLFPT